MLLQLQTAQIIFSTLCYLTAAVIAFLLVFFVVNSALKLFRPGKKTQVSKVAALGLGKMRLSLKDRLGEFIGLKHFDEATYARLEEVLIGADVGVKTTQFLLGCLHAEEKKQEGLSLQKVLSEEILKIFDKSSSGNAPSGSEAVQAHVLMMVGVNGVGKTTSIAKLAHYYQQKGDKVLLAAADTFRAGAVNQLKVWAERIGAATLAQQEGADPASVAFDAVKSGEARRIDRVIIDTAGRLHTKVNLMEELKKIHRVIGKALPGAPHEVWLVIDATQGQNAFQQARDFHAAIGLTGVILTKLDGTAKGGIVIGIANELQVPIRFIGLGEKLEDLKPFQPKDFVEALFA